MQAARTQRRLAQGVLDRLTAGPKRREVGQREVKIINMVLMDGVGHRWKQHKAIPYTADRAPARQVDRRSLPVMRLACDWPPRHRSGPVSKVDRARSTTAMKEVA